MFALTSTHRFYLYRQATDMRKSFDGLSGLVLSQMKRSPVSGEVFLFISKRKDRVKLLRWEEGGYVLYYKRLEAGTLAMPDGVWDGESRQISWPELVLLIEGIVIEKYQQKKRFRLQKYAQTVDN
jgi:transposase